VKNGKSVDFAVFCATFQYAVTDFDLNAVVYVILKRCEDVLRPALRRHQPVSIDKEAEIGHELPLQPDIDERDKA
jgi:hypothetical protein